MSNAIAFLMAVASVFLLLAIVFGCNLLMKFMPSRSAHIALGAMSATFGSVMGLVAVLFVCFIH